MDDIGQKLINDCFKELWHMMQTISDSAQDEGDRVYFGSTNQLDDLRNFLNTYRWEGPVIEIIYNNSVE